MVFDSKEVMNAFMHLEQFYQKIILVNLGRDEFTPIKVDREEWVKVDLFAKFSDWIMQFVNSPYCHEDYKHVFEQFASVERLIELKKPEFIHYRKLIHKEYHDVVMEIIPIGNDLAYFMVKDVSIMVEPFK